VHEVFDISEGEASVAWTKDRDVPASAPKALRLRARDGQTVECVVQAVAVRGTEGEVVQILYALRRKPRTQGYADRLMDTMDGLAEFQEAEPPE
jgi:hypothetical protein